MSGRPSRWWYLLGALLFVVGGSVSFVLGLDHLGDRVAAMPRVVVPGRAALELPAGEQVLFLETRSVLGARVLEGTDDIGDLACSLHRRGGEPVALRAAQPSTHYEVAGYAGRSLAVAEIDAPGPHELRCDGATAEEVVLAVGGDLASALAWMVVPALVFALAGLGAFGFVYARRRHARAA